MALLAYPRRDLSNTAVYLALNLFVILTLSACGDETTNNIIETTGMTLIEKGVKMPDCTDENTGEMVYAADSAAAFFCTDGKWQSLKGEQGEGKQGPKGEDGVGTPGEPGASCTAVAQDDNSGYKIECGGDSVGVVLNGSGCKIAKDEDGVVTIQCDDGKNVTETVLYKAICGDKAYDPNEKFCDARDGKTYRFVTIGEGENTQTWMAENLNYRYIHKTYNGGDADTSSYCYDDDEANCTKYGRLYIWSAAMDSAAVFSTNGKGCGGLERCPINGYVRSVCPEGWRLPDSTDWAILITSVGGDESAGKVLKSKTGWDDYDGASGNGTDAYGFLGLPAGQRCQEFSVNKGILGFIWGAKYYPYMMVLSSNDGAGMTNTSGNGCAYSIRCVKN